MSDINIIDSKFKEWTKGLGPKEARISVFKHIRDIPYAIAAALRDPVTGPAGLLEGNCGSCNPKHNLLGRLFGKLGIPIKYATYSFSWDDPAIKYPPELRELIKRMPTGYHLAVKANIEGKWVLVDATWDPPLKKAGFPVNEAWDGVSGTKNAVTPIEEFLHDTMEERSRFDTEKRSYFTDAQKAVYAEFGGKLNAWLERVRRASA